jgi:hypothetical protein
VASVSSPGHPPSITKVMIDQRGKREIELTEPDENGISAEAVAEMTFLALEFPILEQ